MKPRSMSKLVLPAPRSQTDSRASLDNGPVHIGIAVRRHEDIDAGVSPEDLMITVYSPESREVLFSYAKIDLDTRQHEHFDEFASWVDMNDRDIRDVGLRGDKVRAASAQPARKRVRFDGLINAQ